MIILFACFGGFCFGGCGWTLFFSLGRAVGYPTALLQTRASTINAHGSSSYGFTRSSGGLSAVVVMDNLPVIG